MFDMEQEYIKRSYAHVQARFLTQIDTATLMECVVDPSFKGRHWRQFRLLMLLEIGWRAGNRDMEFKYNCFKAVYGSKAGNCPYLTAPSEGLERESAVH